ncbi:MAG: hypothetical protein K2X76_03130 [Sphingomonas sp.]|nr:hypothetical protein [Sphingomonas sp.]
MRAVKGWLALLLLAACSGPSGAPSEAAPDLEQAAIRAGLIPDPESTDIAGLYARDTDRLCIVRAGGGYRAGAFVDYGDALTCSAAGPVARAGESLSFNFGPDCQFDARFEGDRIVFPGRVPAGCARRCARRASLAALEVDRLSDSPAEAAALRDGEGNLLCPLGG